MTVFANIFFGLRDDAKVVVIDYLQHDEEVDGPYTGPVGPREGRIFKFFSVQGSLLKAHKTPTLGGNVWNLWSIPISEPEYTLQQIRTELDWLLSQYPTQVSIAGAWNWNGEQYGTRHAYSTRSVDIVEGYLNPNYDPNEFLENGDPNPNYDPDQYLQRTITVDEEYISGYTGTPLYPIPELQLLQFMPDIRDGNGNVIGPATELSDVHLSYGQQPRSFFV